ASLFGYGCQIVPQAAVDLGFSPEKLPEIASQHHHPLRPLVLVDRDVRPRERIRSEKPQGPVAIQKVLQAPLEGPAQVAAFRLECQVELVVLASLPDGGGGALEPRAKERLNPHLETKEVAISARVSPCVVLVAH